MKKMIYLLLVVSFILFILDIFYFPKEMYKRISQQYLKNLEYKIENTHKKIILELGSDTWGHFFQVDRIAYHRVETIKENYPMIQNLSFYDSNKQNVLSFIQSLDKIELTPYFQYVTSSNEPYTFVLNSGLFTLYPYIRDNKVSGFILIQWFISNMDLKKYHIVLLDKSNQSIYIPKIKIETLEDKKDIANLLVYQTKNSNINKNEKLIQYLKNNGLFIILDSQFLNLKLGLYAFYKNIYTSTFFYFFLIFLFIASFYIIRDLYILFLMKTNRYSFRKDYKKQLITQRKISNKLKTIVNNASEYFKNLKPLEEKHILGIHDNLSDVEKAQDIYISNKLENKIHGKKIIEMTPMKRKEQSIENSLHKKDTDDKYSEKIDKMRRKVFSLEVKNLVKDITSQDNKNKSD